MGNLASSLVVLVSALWEAGVAGKTLVVAVGYRLLAVGAPDVPNLALNIGTVVVVYVVARRLAKTKIKDGTISDLEKAGAAKDERLKESAERDRARLQQVRQLEQAAHHCQTEATKWRAKYEEAKEYSAQPAVEHFEALLAEHSGKVAERHGMMLDALERMTSTLATIEERLTKGSTST
jgi:vacuolar-type H+-ATPase subunit I/STV1